jgi:hypothetical protein
VPLRISKAQQKRDRATAKKEKLKAKKDANPQRDQEWTQDIDRRNAAFDRYYQVNLFLPHQLQEHI